MRGPGGFGGMDFQKMMKQAQKMQEDLMKAQEDLSRQHVEGSAGGGAVTVVVNGHKDIVSIKIQPAAVDPDDVETLEDLVLTAVRDAQNRASERVQQQMSGLTGGLNIPGLGGL